MKKCRGSCCICFVCRSTLIGSFHVFCCVWQLQEWFFTNVGLIEAWWQVPIIKIPGQFWLWPTSGFAGKVDWVTFRNRLVSWRNINLRRDFWPKVIFLTEVLSYDFEVAIPHYINGVGRKYISYWAPLGVIYFLPTSCQYINNSLQLARKYAWIFVRGHYLFGEANSFPRAKPEENCELGGTDNVQGQISEHIFAPNEGYCLYI